MPDLNRSRQPSHGYWQSLEELAGDDAFTQRLEKEFSERASSPLDDVSRRSVLQLMSASVALAGLTGCRWPEEQIIPFDRRPEGYEPGKIARYATGLDVAGVVRPVLVSSYDGRPIKIEGNPDHPDSGGGADAQTQAAILDLYDNDRSAQPISRINGLYQRTSWQSFEASIPSLFPGPQTRLAVLSQPHSSPTLERVAARLQQRFPALRWYEFSAGRSQNEAAGLESIFGRPASAVHDLGRARVILDFDADLLVSHAEAVKNARAFAAGRSPESMNRLYAFEPMPSGTGAAADHRLPTSPTQVVQALLVLAARLAKSGALAQPQALTGLPSADSFDLTESVMAALEVAAEDLLAHAGQGLVALGERYAAPAHALVQRINRAIGSDAVRYRPAPERSVPRESIEALTAALDASEIDCLLVLGGNPAFDAPPELDFEAAMQKAGASIYLGAGDNETAKTSDWHLPMAHELESWGDHWDAEGRLLATQPLIRPLLDGRSPAELLSLLADEAPKSGHALVKQTFNELYGGTESPDKAWRRFLHDGFVPLERLAAENGELGDELAGAIDWSALETERGDGLELDLRPDSCLHDGRYANNAWLQELPDAMSKLTWGNAVLIGPGLADELGVEHEHLVRVELGGQAGGGQDGSGADGAFELPVYVMPGMAQGTASIALGHGRRFGRVGKDVGVNAYPLQSASERWLRRGVKLTPVGGKGELVTTQDHYAIDNRGRAERERRIDALVREGTLADYEHHPDFAQHMGLHHPPLLSLWQERVGEGHQWGMAIDLNACNGCNACVVACQSENNIPVVGKDEVNNGREMHWMRIDRYFHGDPDEAGVAQQPMACAHCEMAPCEQVCPVGATMHSTEGLNVMAYNRCVGTRYCANNCPYKVRRFNFFEYNGEVSELEQLGKNPEVTIRSRGVMEKCTYCVQRIEHARIAAKNAGREIEDGDVVTACQQTCPSQAITFGDLSDPESEVSKMHADSRAYGVLAELNTKPRTVYLARLRNPHPKLSPPADAHGEHGSGHGSGGHGAAEHGASDHDAGHDTADHAQKSEPGGGH